MTTDATVPPSRAELQEHVLEQCEREQVRFINLQFTDIVGIVKSVTIPSHRLPDAFDHGTWFDGSSIEGFARIAESDMYLDPDPATFAIVPWESGNEKTARLICDVYTPEGNPFPGDPRYVLRRAMAAAAEMGFVFNTGPELEFFLLQVDDAGDVLTMPHDEGGYFDLSTDLAAQVRRDMVVALEAMGMKVEASHHEVATGQHEIDFQYDNALRTADHTVTFRYTLKAIARQAGPLCHVHAQAAIWHQRVGDAHASEPRGHPYRREPFRRPGRTVWSLRPRAPLHRRYLGACSWYLRGTGAARQLVQAPGAGLRSASLRQLGAHQSLRPGPCPQAHPQPAPEQPHRVAVSRPELQSVPRVRGDAARRPGRYSAGAGAATAARGKPVRVRPAPVAAGAS